MLNTQESSENDSQSSASKDEMNTFYKRNLDEIKILQDNKSSIKNNLMCVDLSKEYGKSIK